MPRNLIDLILQGLIDSPVDTPEFVLIPKGIASKQAPNDAVFGSTEDFTRAALHYAKQGEDASS